MPLRRCRSIPPLGALGALAALLAVPACASAPRTAQASARATAVDVASYAMLLRMADARRLDTDVVRAALRSHLSAERAAAARAIGQVHGAAMASTLRTLLADRDSAVAADAALSLGLLRDSASIPALVRALDAPGPVAPEAAWALGQIGAPAAGAITAALRTTSAAPHAATAYPDGTLGALLLAAAKLRPTPAALVEPYLHDPRAAIRWRAAYVIARPLDPAGVREVLPLAGDTSAEVRAQVARALAKRAAGDSLAAAALPALLTLAADRDPHVRVNALHSLGGYGADARAAVLRAVHDPDANVRITAAATLGQVLDATRAAWMEAWRADTGFMYRRSLLAAALEVDVVLPAADFDNPDGWRHIGDWRYRAAVADAGAHATSMERLRDVALPAVRDPDPRVRLAAYGAMAPHADTAEQHPWRREFMYVGLTDWDPFVRALSVESLIGHATAAEVPRVLASYRMALRDSVRDARLASIRFFAAAWHRDSAAFPDSIVAALRALPASDDPRVRAAARGGSLFSAWPPLPMRDPHPLAWYEARVRSIVLPALAGHRPHAELETSRGPIDIELFAVDAPLTVDNFLALARRGYYQHLTFHRVVPNFVVQDGDGRGDGNGGPVATIRDELNRRRYDRGVVGMALSGPDTGGSQYFITLSPQPHLDGGYTVFGRVVSGFAALDAIVQGDSVSVTAPPLTPAPQ